ncbi:hypothetical protein P152DRAFT_397970 [Eremomyces bilateralis CBS 781.70]|uniref:BZIP domain-containing protein n=1 Tax=Eremomyces bilateralis CBS 781.70 TaxID=1392243 RepID=A0A6G1G188_9PEZI|nr:uncharacterized protein P152DRAFT_397970 [Eremomyces bilateralis CBS 781.70]KAF1811875.1 hypothetical protein P152DRAFT_397970 [Eremomyces bilateralis CBS 781.70]
MAAVATRSSNNSPHLNNRISNAVNADTTGSTSAPSTEARNDSKVTQDSNPTSNAQPLAPPPRPAQTSTATDTPDYFSSLHNNNQQHLYEPNPFEAQFGSSSTETPGKSFLPGVASLTSPSSLLPGNTPGWTNSLRSGPLSPAMLAGPANPGDYFGEPSFSRGFPTPNESSLRTGLTPGGGGTMFPAPSPNSQALFNSFAGGGQTPGTLEFQRTALAVNAAKGGANPPTSQPPATTGMDTKAYPATTQAGGHDPFAGDANDAANGLFMLAQANGARNGANSFAVPNPPTSVAPGPDASPMVKPAGKHSSIGSISAPDTNENMSDSESEPPSASKPLTRSKGRKGATKGAANNRRKREEETPAKGNANKRSKQSFGSVGSNTHDENSDDDEDMKDEEMMLNEKGKKMTDEEKRKNFLERNRVAALKCRQRKKQWLANLQQKCELYTTENDHLTSTVNHLREEIVTLKTLLMAHKDCPVSQAQGLNSAALSNMLDGPGAGNPMGGNMLGVSGAPGNVGMVGMGMPAGPYGMGNMPNGVGMGMMGVAGGNQANVQRK